MTRDPRIDDYIAKAAPFSQGILAHVRALVHRALPGVEEGIKWGMPHFMADGRNLVAMAAFKAHASVTIHHEQRTGEGMGSLGKLASLADLPPDEELIARFEACHQALSRPKPARAPRAELPLPPAFAAALAAAPEAQRAFDGFAPSHRREYIEWIAEAKREDTRERRVAQAIIWLAEGRKRHWKSDKC